MDGNGRWAKKRGQPRSVGHYMGGRNLFKIAGYAESLGLKSLTVYAFSTENWKRPEEEIKYLMQAPVDYYYKNIEKIKNLTYKMSFIGRRDRIPKTLLDVVNEIEEITKNNQGFELIIALDYGSYDEIINAVNASDKPLTEDKLNEKLYLNKKIDLLIRTSGEQRISNFLLWQIAYAELYFTKKHWPAFSEKELDKAIKNYNKRNRRFGGL
jgi:undecaprenyl diphosphate synthase